MKQSIALISFIFIILGCSKESEKPNSDIILNYEKTNPSAYLSSDGQIALKIEGGVKPYTVIWIKDHPYNLDTMENSSTSISNLTAGMYFVVVSDKKKNEAKCSIFLSSYDTILPKEYFPVFPGSTWTYSNGETIQSANKYQKVGVFHILRKTFTYSENTNTYWPNDSIYLPIWNGIPILEYFFINSDEDWIPKIPIMHSVELQKTATNQDQRYGVCVIMTEKIDTTINIDNQTFSNVVVTIEGCAYGLWADSFPEQFSNLERKFYAKDVGLIRVDFKEYPFTSFTTEKEITSWNINNSK
jgi:hypothetical protein